MPAFTGELRGPRIARRWRSRRRECRARVRSSASSCRAFSSTPGQHVARVVQRRLRPCRRRTPRRGARPPTLLRFSSAMTAPSSSSHATATRSSSRGSDWRRAAPSPACPIWNHVEQLHRRAASAPPAPRRARFTAAPSVGVLVVRGDELADVAEERLEVRAAAPGRACGRRGPSPGCGWCPRRSRRSSRRGSTARRDSRACSRRRRSVWIAVSQTRKRLVRAVRLHQRHEQVDLALVVGGLRVVLARERRAPRSW